MILQLEGTRQFFVPQAAGLPVLLLGDVGGRDEDALVVLAAGLDGLLDDLTRDWGTVSLTRSLRPVSSG